MTVSTLPLFAMTYRHEILHRWSIPYVFVNHSFNWFDKLHGHRLNDFTKRVVLLLTPTTNNNRNASHNPGILPLLSQRLAGTTGR
jgi:hypothetical protein